MSQEFIVSFRVSPEVNDALQAHLVAMRSTGDPNLTESAVARTLLVDGLRRAGRFKSGDDEKVRSRPVRP